MKEILLMIKSVDKGFIGSKMEMFMKGASSKIL
jgi:hypothetical protein